MVLAGWGLKIAALITLLPGLASMKANTALCFILLGAAGFLVQSQDPKRVTWGRGLALIVAVIGLLTLAEIIFQWDLGIDQLLFRDVLSSIATSAPGRMSVPTALCFVLLGLVSAVHERASNNLRQIPILIAFVLAASVFVSYPFSLVFGTTLFSYTGMALHTSIFFILLSSALLFSRPVYGWLELILSKSALGDSTRSLLVTAVLVPFLLGWLIFYGESAGWYEAGFARSTYSVAVMFFLSVIIAYTSQKLFQAESAHSLLKTDFRQIQQQLSALVENSPSAIFIKDVKGNYQLVNSHFEQLVGKNRDQILGKKAQAIFADDLLSGVLGSDKSVIESRGIVTTEMNAQFQGTPRTYLNTKFPLLAEDGSVQGIGGMWTDITEQKTLSDVLSLKNEELQRSNKELEQFAYVASHDLQEPLRMVSSYMQLLEGRYADKLDQDAKEFINYAVDGASRMQRLIQDLLAFSRVGTRGKDPEVVDANLVVQEALNNLKIRIEETGAIVSVKPDLPALIADRNQLVQLFQNLLGNALKFSGEKTPEVHVDVKQSDTFAEFSVADNGIGFDVKHVDRIFVIFQRLNNREQYEGTGIGLAICKKIVERHGGRIWADSQIGKGSTFHFTFPLAVPMNAELQRQRKEMEKKEGISAESIEERAGRLI